MLFLILILLLIPVISKISFWLYAIQLKEYRRDRFKEYILTPQWRKAIFNKIFLLEVTTFLILLFLYLINNIIYLFSILIILLIIENIIYSLKIFKKNIIIPDFTWRMIILIFLSSTLIVFSGLLLFYISLNSILFLIFILIAFPYLFIFISNILLTPLVNFQKNKLYNKAIKKSNTFNDVIKIWITWSYWKSSIKEILSCFLESEWKILKTPKNINTEMWVSRLILNKLSDKFNYFIAELWAYRIWEISLLWKIVNHKYWFLTAIWNQHIWLFWSQSNIIKAKKEICESIIKNKGVLYVNWDNNFLRLTDFDENLNIVKYWFHKDSDMIVDVVNISDWITNIKINYKWVEYFLWTNLIWDHNILNLSWVLAFCLDQGISLNSINKNILDIKLPKDTCEVIVHKKLRLINDTYNLSVDWLKSWLNVLNSFEWDKILVVDDILELWIDSRTVHFDLWKYIWSEEWLNKVLLCWVNYKEDFTDWLLDWGFIIEDIITNLDLINWEKTILFAWKKAKKYFNEIIKNV